MSCQDISFPETTSRVFKSRTTEEVCQLVESAILKQDVVSCIPHRYKAITMKSPDDIQEWFDEMKNDPDATSVEGPLREVYGLFQAALARLRELGVHRP